MHWYCNLSEGVIKNCQWAVSKPDTRICFPHKVVEGCGKGAGFSDCTCCSQYIDCLQDSSYIYSSLKLCK